MCGGQRVQEKEDLGVGRIGRRSTLYPMVGQKENSVEKSDSGQDPLQVEDPLHVESAVSRKTKRIRKNVEQREYKLTFVNYQNFIICSILC